MNFFKKLFNKKKDDSVKFESSKEKPNSNSAGKSYNNFLENGLPEMNFTLMDNQAMDLITSVSAIDKALKKRNISFDVKGFYYTKLYENGILNIPLVFKSGNLGYSLFFIYEEEQAKIFNFAKDQLKDSEYKIPLYISSIDCKKVTQQSSRLTPFSLSDLSYNEKPELKGEFGMWWNEENDPIYYKSATKKYLEEIYTCIRGYESYIFGYLLSEIKMKDFENFQRVALPAEEKSFVVKGPEYLDIVISVSQEKGIRFLFPKDKASIEYRSLLLSKIKTSFQAFQLLIEMKEAPKDEVTDSNGYDWFNFMSRVIEKKEKEGEIDENLSIGIVSFN